MTSELSSGLGMGPAHLDQLRLVISPSTSHVGTPKIMEIESGKKTTQIPMYIIPSFTRSHSMGAMNVAP